MKSQNPYIIAEVNSSHFGKIETALKMIDELSRCKVDCVKFQSWTSETLYSKEYYNQNKIAHRVVKGFSF
jgi:sialic acid synthase SpsE